LARAVRGKTGDPYPRLCPNCEKELGDLEDREISCRTDNCPGTFTWTREQQLAAGVRPKLREEAEALLADAAQAGAPAALAASPEEAGKPAAQAAPAEVPAAGDAAAAAGPAPAAEGQGIAAKPKKAKKKRKREIQPPERRCAACAEFLANRKTQEIPCGQCGTPIFWPPESQLQTHLGNWAAPSMCGACKLVQVQAAREVAREQLRHSHPQPGASEASAPTEPAHSEPPAEG